MKTAKFAVIVLALGLVAVPLNASQKPEPKEKEEAPKYDVAAEGTYKVVIEEVKDRECPVSGGMGNHILVKLDGKIFEVHVAPTKFVKSYEVLFQKGDVVEIIGTKIKFQGVDAILSRQITRGQDAYTFRDPKGNPIW